jgi:hypothetical protein
MWLKNFLNWHKVLCFLGIKTMPMKYFKLLAYFIAGLALLLSSCSMQKRVYSKGYTIHWKKKQHAARAHDQLAHSNPAAQQPEDALVSALAAQPAMLNDHYTEKQQAAASITTSEKAQVSLPAFHKKMRLATPEKNNYGPKLAVKEQKQSQKQLKAKDAGAGGKSQIVALLLCIFLGLLGVHRFYLGYTGMGLLYLFTAGILGIGWIIDIVLLIIPNGLTPKNKTSYDE